MDENANCDAPTPERSSGIGDGLLPLILFLVALVGANWSVMVCAADLLVGSHELAGVMTDKPETRPTMGPAALYTDAGVITTKESAAPDLQRAKDTTILNASCASRGPAVPGRAYKNRKMLIAFSIFELENAAMITTF